MRRAVVIVNPVNVDAERLRSAVTAAEEDDWLPSVWLETTVDDPGQGAARTAVEHEPDLVIVVGGDGTIRAVAEEVHGHEIPVAIVATGTGNLLARNLDVVADIEASVRTAFTGRTRAIDAGVVHLEYEDRAAAVHVFLVMAGMGLDARMATDTDAALKKRIGWFAYADPIRRSILSGERFSMRYRLDAGREREVRAHTVIVGNCGTLTAGIPLLPQAKRDDGLLDVVLFRPSGFWQWLRVGSRLGTGWALRRWKVGRAIMKAIPGLRTLQYGRARTLSASFEQPQSIQLDGDGFGEVISVDTTVRKHALGIRVNP